MPIKHWILHRMNRMNRIVGRSDLRQPREPSLRGAPDAQESAPPDPGHLGAYAPLIAAIRDELEHFVSSQLRLHLAIAERDRYLLTSIEVECVDGGDGADLLRRFSREFTPEQVKRFLARDVIGHLPNAGAIDLSQFAGLNATRAHGDQPGEDDAYAELVEQLRATTPSEGPRAFDVTLLGRWTETEATPMRASAASLQTPLAGSRLDIEIEDAGGNRHLTLSSIVPNRRYAVGKGDGCEIAVDGTFVSRRHCEIWLENGSWWAADAGSTNGIRVESSQSVLGRAGPPAGEAQSRTAIEIVPGAHIVLSARAQGKPADYPRVLLKQQQPSPAPATPLAPGTKVPMTPVTPIAAPLKRAPAMTLNVSMSSGNRVISLNEKTLPLRIGRSRNQDLVVDWSHEGVSGHHIEIASVDGSGAQVQVHGDNGVCVGDVTHAAGTSLRWRIGERMTLGRASGSEPECTLTLSDKAQ